MPRSAGLLSCLVSILLCVVQAAGQRTVPDQGRPAEELEIFKGWLAGEHPGYGCDEGPARFRNGTVEAAYDGRRFYYVLTYPRGIRPPFQNSLSLIAYVDEKAAVHPLDLSSVEAYRPGLRKVSTTEAARQAAAAVLILAMGDPGERRWKFQGSLFKVKRSRKGWVCTYAHGDAYHTSQVRFDRKGVLSAVSCNPPPVP